MNTPTQSAMARYPDVEPDLAQFFFESDRQRAGMGALRPTSRGRGEVQNIKRANPENGMVTYRMSISRRAKHMLLVWPEMHDGNAPLATKFIPAKESAIHFGCDPHDFHDLEPRNRIAQSLKRARRELMEF